MVWRSERKLGSGLEESLEGDVWHIRLNRPGKKNAITMAMFTAFGEALRLSNAKEEVKAVVVSGNGDVFTAGHDRADFEAWPQSSTGPVSQFLNELALRQKPLVVAVHGVAIGIGATMLLHADWVCCTRDAELRFPFINLGIGPEAASTILLRQVVGLLRAKRLLLGGDSVQALDAYQWGLVSELVDSNDLLTTAVSRARALGNKPRAVYTQIRTWLEPPRDQLLARVGEEIGFINECLARAHRHGP